MIKVTACLLTILASTAHADLDIRFVEGAPKDRFSVTNTGACPLEPMKVTLDLGTAPAGLIFDVTGSGAGVEVYQPFELVAGADLLTNQPKVLDGDTAITFDLNGLGTGQSFAFTIDIDDTGGATEITVSGSEIAGASTRMMSAGVVHEAQFGTDARATIPLAACLS